MASSVSLVPGFSNNDYNNDYAAHIWYRCRAPRQLMIGMVTGERSWRAECTSRSRWNELGVTRHTTGHTTFERPAIKGLAKT